MRLFTPEEPWSAFYHDGPFESEKHSCSSPRSSMVSSFLLTRYIPPFFFEAFINGCFLSNLHGPHSLRCVRAPGRIDVRFSETHSGQKPAEPSWAIFGLSFISKHRPLVRVVCLPNNLSRWNFVQYSPAIGRINVKMCIRFRGPDHSVFIT